MDDTLTHNIATALLFLFFENRKALLYHDSTYLPNDSNKLDIFNNIKLIFNMNSIGKVSL